MATITIEYEADGDVELILQTQTDDTSLGQAITNNSSSDGQEKPTSYQIGPSNVKVNRFCLRVSALKLISSSRYFQAMLEGSTFREGKELNDHGYVEIELINPEDKPSAMMIILGIIYGSDVHVPDKLDLPTFYNVAVLVDKYQWHQLVAPHAVLWFDILAKSIDFPDIFNETLMMCLWMAWLFEMKDHFRTLSRTAQQDARNSIDLTDEGIRLPIKVLEAINKQRELGFSTIEERLKSFRSQLLDRTMSSTPQMRVAKSMVYGLTTLCLQDLELGEFAPPDHAGRSFRSLSADIKHYDHKVLSLYILINDVWYVQNLITMNWNVLVELKKAVEGIKIEDWGLEYDDFKP